MADNRLADLDDDIDESLRRTTLSKIVRQAAAGPTLKRIALSSNLLDVEAIVVFEAGAQARFRAMPGVGDAGYNELVGLVNAYAIRLRLDAINQCAPAAAEKPTQKAVAADHTPKRPGEVLAETGLRDIVLRSNTSKALRRFVLKSKSSLLDVDAATFLADDDAEGRFRKATGLDLRAYLELSDCVNVFTDRLYREPQRTMDPVAPGDPESTPGLGWTLRRLVRKGPASKMLRLVAEESDLFQRTIAELLANPHSKSKFMVACPMTADVYRELRALALAAERTVAPT